MENRTNTIAGWVLAAMGTALALSIFSNMAFKSERPEKEGYQIVAAEAPSDGPAVPAVPFMTMMASAEVTKGAAVFAKCKSCHTIEQGGPNGIGPNLYATVGEGIAEGKAGFAFSDALKAKGAGQKWTFELLNEWLTNPKKFAEGTKMSFAGLEKQEDRANVIAYLNSMGSNLPLPKADATPAPAAAPAADATAGNTAAPAK
jgi:cytochrome c